MKKIITRAENKKARDLKSVEGFCEQHSYSPDQASKRFIAEDLPKSILEDLWELIAYQGMTEEQGLETIEKYLSDKKNKWEGGIPYRKLFALSIAKTWIKDSKAYQWSYPPKQETKKLEEFFKFAVDNSIIDETSLIHLKQKHESNWDLIIGEILNLSLHVREYNMREAENSTVLGQILRKLLFLFTTPDEIHAELLLKAELYYSALKREYREWVKMHYPEDLKESGSGEEFNYLLGRIGAIRRMEGSYIFIEGSWVSAIEECKKNLLAGWEKRKRWALQIQEHHVVQTPAVKLLNRAEEEMERAEEALMYARMNMDYFETLAQGIQISLPPIVRIKGKPYFRDEHPPGSILEEAHRWHEEAHEELIKARASCENDD